MGFPFRSSFISVIYMDEIFQKLAAEELFSVWIYLAKLEPDE